MIPECCQLEQKDDRNRSQAVAREVPAGQKKGFPS